MYRVSGWAVVFLLFCACGACAAGTILTPVSVTCTGEYNTSYPCIALIDGITNDRTYEPSGNASYWLGREDPNSYQPYLNETFTVDIGYVDLISGFHIYNTHNGLNETSNDRGTLNFTVWVSSELVSPDTYSSSFGTEVLTDTPLVFTAFLNPNAEQVFSIAPTSGRYVTFRATNVSGFGSAGLSEFQLDGTPEPATFLLAGVALLALASLRRRIC